MIFDKNSLRKVAAGFAMVTEAFAFCISGFLIGYFLDYYLEKTKPWLTVCFVFLGFIAGMIRLYKMYIKEEGRNDS